MFTFVNLRTWMVVLAVILLFDQMTMGQQSSKENVYRVKPISGAITIDANWDKEVWANVEAVELINYMGQKPEFSPVTHAKLLYDQDHIYGIFRVQDRFVLSKVMNVNGHVSGDSCVEFFFSPDENSPLKYFNLEINAGGTPLLHYVTEPRKTYQAIDAEHIQKIDIAHSMPREITTEIPEDTVWTIEFKVPLSMLTNFGTVTTPAPGVKWKANFYKTASRTSNPHYFTWNVVENPRPDFHLPQYFGTLIFE